MAVIIASPAHNMQAKLLWSFEMRMHFLWSSSHEEMPTLGYFNMPLLVCLLSPSVSGLCTHIEVSTQLSSLSRRISSWHHTAKPPEVQWLEIWSPLGVFFWKPAPSFCQVSLTTGQSALLQRVLERPKSKSEEPVIQWVQNNRKNLPQEWGPFDIYGSSIQEYFQDLFECCTQQVCSKHDVVGMNEN